jgi:diguanylate cyclase (GGDEF)-like protein
MSRATRPDPAAGTGCVGKVLPFRRRGADAAAGAAQAVTDENEASAEAAALAAEASSKRAAQRRRDWLRECWIIAASYVLNGVCLGLYAVTGSVHWAAGVLYAVPGLVVTGIVGWLIGTRRSERFRDASLTPVHGSTSVFLLLLGLALFPSVSFMYTLFLFPVLLTVTYRLNRRQTMQAWAVVSVLTSAIVLWPGHGLQLPHETPAERLVTWISVSTVVARCVLLSVINTMSTQLLKKREQQMVETLATIERLAKYDELTGVLNRRSLLHILSDERARTDRSGSPTSVAIFDLDHFKRLNDTYGHPVGDRALRLFAQQIDKLSRRTDRFGRYGGEEFLVVMTDTDLEKAEIAVQRLRDGLAAVDWSVVAPGYQLTFSAGIATYRSGESPEQLLERADQGLYGAKHAGRNCTRAG